jgi:hypothetical protein
LAALAGDWLQQIAREIQNILETTTFRKFLAFSNSLIGDSRTNTVYYEMCKKLIGEMSKINRR